MEAGRRSISHFPYVSDTTRWLNLPVKERPASRGGARAEELSKVQTYSSRDERVSEVAYCHPDRRDT